MNGSNHRFPDLLGLGEAHSPLADLEDPALIKAYVQQHSQAAFTALVQRHLDFVYAMARRKVTDHHLAEDVTQAVFIILAQKARTMNERTPLPVWLFRVTRYACANARKKETRRQFHERAAGVVVVDQNSTAESGTGDWEQMAPLLDDAVAALNERDRRAVILRFYSQRSWRDVGAALGVSEKTAFMRVDRAMDKLRAILTRKGVAIAGAGLATLIAAHTAPAAPTTLAQGTSALALAAVGHGTVTTSAATIAKGVSTMMTWAKVKLAAAVIGAVVITSSAGVVVIQQSMAAPAQTPAVAPAPPVVAQGSIPASQSPTPIAVTQPATLPATAQVSGGPALDSMSIPAPVIQGTVVDYRGQPVADGMVMVIRETTSRRRESQVVSQMRTPADGRFTAQLPDASSEYRVVVRKAGLAVGWDAIERRKGQLVSDVNIVLDEPGEIGGTVVDESGHVVAGAQVRTWVWGERSHTALLSGSSVPWLEARTDANGHFSIGQLPVDATVELWVMASGKAPYHSRREDSKYTIDHGFLPGQTNLRISLKPAGQIAGRVVDQETGKPVPGVDIRVIDDSDWDRPQVTSASDGTFFLDGLAGGVHRVLLEQVGYASDDHGFISAPVAVNVQPGSKTTDVLIPAQRGGVLQLLVQGKPDGRPVPDAFVEIRADIQDATFDPWVHTISGQSDKDGIAHFRLPAGRYVLDGVRNYTDRFHAWEHDSSQFTVEAGTTRQVIVPLRTLPRLPGQAVDAQGRGVAKAIVEINGNLACDQDTQTDGQGGFTLLNGGSDNVAGSFVLIRQPERNLVGLMDVAPESPRLVVPLQPGNILTGRVVDENGQGIPGVILSLNMYWDEFFMTLYAPPVTDAQGRYQVGALPAGRKYGLRMDKLGFTAGSTRHTFADDEQGKTINLPDVVLKARNQEIAGIVVDEKGVPVFNALITLDRDRPHTRSDSQGRFILRRLGSGQATLEVRMYVDDPQAVEVPVTAGAKGVRITYSGAGIAIPPDANNGAAGPGK